MGIETATLAHRDADGVEEVLVDDVRVERRFVTLRSYRDPGHVAGEWGLRDRSRAPDVGPLAEALDQCGRWRLGPKIDETVEVVGGVHLRRFVGAADQDARADEEGKAQGDLQHDQKAAQPAGTHRPAQEQAVALEHNGRLHLCGLERGEERTTDTHDDGEEEGGGDDAGIDGYRQHAHARIGDQAEHDALHRGHAQQREAPGDERGDDRHHEALGEQMADEPSARGP